MWGSSADSRMSLNKREAAGSEQGGKGRDERRKQITRCGQGYTHYIARR